MCIMCNKHMHSYTKTHTCHEANQDFIVCLQTTIYHQDKEQWSEESRGTDRTIGGREINKTKEGIKEKYVTEIVKYENREQK